MGVRRHYRIQGEDFPTATSLRERIRAILSGHPGDEPLGPAESAFMADVLRMHPDAADKIGTGIVAISVRSNPPYSTRGFWATRADGSETGWSYEDCLACPRTPMDFFLRAARNAVFPSICRYRDEHLVSGMRCMVTGGQLTPGNVHVHHREPATFRALARDYLSGHPIDLVNCSRDQFGLGAVFRDPAERDSWVRWHDERAEYELLSIEGHKLREKWAKDVVMRMDAPGEGMAVTEDDFVVEES